MRFSPKGDSIAFFEHPRKLDDRGSVNTVDLSGNNTVLSDGYWSLRGLAWAPDGKEILFSASQSGGSYTVYGVTMAGSRRTAYQPPGGFIIQDVARDGRWLATRLDFRYAAMVHTPGMDGDRDLSWLNTSHARALSQDAQTLLFSETARIDSGLEGYSAPHAAPVRIAAESGSGEAFLLAIQHRGTVYYD